MGMRLQMTRQVGRDEIERHRRSLDDRRDPDGVVHLVLGEAAGQDRLLVRLHAALAAVDGAHRQAEELEVDLAAGWFGDAVHSQAGRLLAVDVTADEVAEPVVDVVHPHQRRCGGGVLHHRAVGLPARLGDDGSAKLRVAGGDRRGDRRPPALRRRERALGQHTLQVQLQIARGLGDGVAQVVERRHRQAISSVGSPRCQLQGQSSSVWSASSTRSTSSTLRPTSRSVTDTKRTIPSGSTMNVARIATPAVGCRMPSAFESSCLMSDSIGNGRSLRSGWFLRQATWTNSLSVLTPSTWASRSAKSRFLFPNAAISVGQTKVKSLGQKNTTFHLPGYSSLVRSWNSFPFSRLTAAVSWNAGNLSPMVNIVVTSWRSSCRRAADRAKTSSVSMS